MNLPRRDLFALSLVGLLALSLWLPRLEGPIDLRWDGGVYYTLGDALAEGNGYRLRNEPGNPLAVQYPPLFPAAIAMHRWLAGTDDPFAVGRWLRRSACAVFVAFALLLYLFFRGSLPTPHSLLCSLICLLHLNALFFSDLCFPEIAFTACTVGFFVARGSEGRDSALSIPLLYAAFGLRTVGVALLGAWVAESLIARRYRTAAARLGLGLLPIAAWLIYVASVEASASYERPAYEYQRAPYAFYNVSYARNVFVLKDGFEPEAGPAGWRDLADRFATNLTYVPSAFGESTSLLERVLSAEWKEAMRKVGLDGVVPSPAHAAIVAMGLLVLVSVGLQLRRRRWLAALYVLASTAMACLTPWPGQLARYAMPLSPFLLLAVGESFAFAEDRLTGSGRRLVVGFGTIVFSVILVLQAATIVVAFQRWHGDVRIVGRSGTPEQFRSFFYQDAYRVLDGGLDWLLDQATEKDVLALSMPHWAYLRTGRKAVMPPFEADPAVAQRMLDSVPVEYLFVDPGLALDATRYTLPVIRAFPEKWQPVYVAAVNDEYGQPLRPFEIYRRSGEPAVAAEPAR